MRTFLAVRPPAPALEHLQAVLPRWPSAPERWHLTLAFLGECPESAVAPIRDILEVSRRPVGGLTAGAEKG